MFKHEKQLLQNVRVDKPNPNYAAMLQEQLGGAIRDTIDFLLNHEEAHNAMFREAFNKIQDTGSLNDWGITKDSKLYFDLSTPGKYFNVNNPKAASFNTPPI